MSSNRTAAAPEAVLTSNPLDVVPDQIPFDVPYGPPISLERTEAAIHAAVAEARKRNWKMNVAIADSGGNLVAFQRMDGARPSAGLFCAAQDCLLPLSAKSRNRIVDPGKRGPSRPE
jgi:hypothetical protein